jgi:hypothetical protein
MKLLFTTDNMIMKGGKKNKNPFKIMTTEEIEKNTYQNKTMMNYITNFISIKDNKLNYVKASQTKKYYQNIKNKI